MGCKANAIYILDGVSKIEREVTRSYMSSAPNPNMGLSSLCAIVALKTYLLA